MTALRSLVTDHRKNVALLVLACAVFPWATSHGMPGWLSESTSLVIAQGVAIAVAALSLNLLIGYAGQLSLGHAALLGAGAFAASVVIDRLRMTMFLGWIAAAVAGGALALVIGIPALRLRGLYLALVTMVFGLTMRYSILRWDFFTHGSAGALLPRRVWGSSIVHDPSIFLSLTLLVLLGVWLVDRNVMRTRLGRAFQIIREDEAVAQSFGVDVTRYKILAFVLSGAIAGLAGALYGASIGLVNSDTFNLNLSLRLVLIVIIGGVGRRWGVALVAVLLALSPKLPSFLGKYDLVVAAAVVIYNVVRLPTGLAGFVDGLRVAAADRRRAALAPDEEDIVIPNLLVVAPPRLDARQGGVADASATDQVLLRVEDVSVRFGGLAAVDGVSLETRRATIVGIIGPNGAGKSTFFNAISGLLLPAEAHGRIVLDGQPLHDLAPSARAAAGLGRTFQLVGLAKEMSVRENIVMAQHQAARYSDVAALLYSASVDRTERALGELADDVIAGLGFDRFRDVPLRQLSGGQQRLVELAAVLATHPKLLMLDEPTAGLSPAAAENLADRLHALRAEHGQSILLIEHNVPLVLDLCDYVYVLNAGQLLADGAPDTLARNPEVLSAYLGEAV